MMRTAPTPEEKKLRQLIHVAKRELGMDDGTYRTMLRAAGGAESTSEMRAPQLRRVLDQAKKAGFQVRAKAKTSGLHQDRRQDTSDEARKVRALWLYLHQLGVVRDPSERALAAYVKRIAHVDDLHWAHGDAMLRLIETMKKWAMRFLPEKVEGLRLEAAQARTEGRISPQHLEAIQGAFDRLGLRDGEGGFDLWWGAWESLTTALAAIQAGVKEAP